MMRISSPMRQSSKSLEEDYHHITAKIPVTKKTAQIADTD
jgi:hypothetical protein